MKREDLSQYFLEKLLHKKIVEIKTISIEKFYQSIITEKFCRLDVFIKDSKGINYDIECQARDREDYYTPLRQRYYHSSMDNEALLPNQTYLDLPKSYVIFICTFDYANRNSVIYDFPYKLCSTVENLKMDDGQRTIIIYSKGQKNRHLLHPDILNFLDYFNGLNPVGEFAKEVAEEVYNIKLSKISEGLYMRYSLAMQDSFIRGRKEGKYEGRKEGRDEGRKEIIFDMFRNNITVDQMSNFISLEKTKLLELKKEYDKINIHA